MKFFLLRNPALIDDTTNFVSSFSLPSLVLVSGAPRLGVPSQGTTQKAVLIKMTSGNGRLEGTDATPSRIADQAEHLRQQSRSDRRWRNTKRTFTAQDVIRLSGTPQERHTPAHLAAR